MKKKMLGLVGVMMLSAGLLAGCGSAEKIENEADVTSTQEDATEVTGNDETSEETEAQEVQAPVLTDLSDYDTIISQLQPGQAYAFADMDKDHDALLVTTEGCFDNGDGNMAAISAEIYCFDKDGNVIDYGSVMSDGTAYPLAIYDSCLMFGGNHHMGMEYIDEATSSIITKEDAEVQYSEDGSATYFYFNYDEEFEGQVDDDSKLNAMYDKYGEAVVINFTVVE